MHNLFNERFFSFREPPWHQLGIVSETPKTAKEAWENFPYDVGLQTLLTDQGLKLKERAIVRPPTADDPEHRIFGLVGPEYVLITPGEIVEMWDDRVGGHVETMGALGFGETFFISMKIGGYDIRGDQVDEYMLVEAPLYGNAKAALRLTPIRAVCQNTLIAAADKSTLSYGIRHVKGAHEQFGDWLSLLHSNAVSMSEGMKELFGQLASAKIPEVLATDLLAKIYPEPSLPKRDVPPDVYETKLVSYEEVRRTALRNRDAAYELFSGVGTGMDSEAAQGTGWGLYNAVVELEDYRGTTTAGYSPRDNSRRRDALFGYRAQNKARAFEVILQEVQ